jgi:hypothetical protein
MKNAEIEFHDDHALLSILTDDLTELLEKRLYADGWELATNGYKEGGKWFTIFIKFI